MSPAVRCAGRFWGGCVQTLTDPSCLVHEFFLLCEATGSAVAWGGFFLPGASGAQLGPQQHTLGAWENSVPLVRKKKGGGGRGNTRRSFPNTKATGCLPPCLRGGPAFLPYTTTHAHISPLPPPTAPTRHPHEATRRDAGKQGSRKAGMLGSGEAGKQGSREAGKQ